MDSAVVNLHFDVSVTSLLTKKGVIIERSVGAFYSIVCQLAVLFIGSPVDYYETRTLRSVIPLNPLTAERPQPPKTRVVSKIDYNNLLFGLCDLAHAPWLVLETTPDV